jgi:membrane-bound serine protease (ClpP class)
MGGRGRQIDGRRVQTAAGTETLHTKGARIEYIEMGWSEKFLDIISDPNFLLIFIMLGSAGLLLELYNPGSIFPGIVGVLSYILMFYSMHVLPINYAGLALIIFGIVLFLLEIKIVSHGMLAIGGAVSLFLGSIMLIRPSSELELAQISWFVIIATVAVSTFFFLFLLGLGLKVQRRKPTTGVEGLVGEIGEAYTPLEPEGTVRIHGEFWHAESSGGDVAKGERIRVTQIHNLKLRVERTK